MSAHTTQDKTCLNISFQNATQEKFVVSRTWKDVEVVVVGLNSHYVVKNLRNWSHSTTRHLRHCSRCCGYCETTRDCWASADFFLHSAHARWCWFWPLSLPFVNLLRLERTHTVFIISAMDWTQNPDFIGYVSGWRFNGTRVLPSCTLPGTACFS